MKKIWFMVLSWLVVILGGCSQKQVIHNNTSSVYKNMMTGWNHLVVKKKQNIIEESLSSFDKWIIKMAVKKWTSVCKSLSSKEKITYCENLVKNEQENYKKGNCDKLVYLKQSCLDEQNYKKLDCEKILNWLKKRECILQKNFKKVVKNWNIKQCNQFPYPQNKECEKLLTK